MSIDNNLISLFNQKKFKEFIIHAEKNYVDHPNNIDLIILISISYAECDDFVKARDFIYKGYMLDSANENVLYNFAKISEELGNQTEAEDLYDQLLEINPRRTDALNNLARLKLNQKAYDIAEGLFKKCLDISKNSKLAFQGLADLYISTNQKCKELEILKRSFENHGNDRDVMLAYCSCLIKNNQTNYARTVMESNYKKFKEDIDFILLMAGLYSKMNNLHDMRKSSERALFLDPINIKATCMLGICYLRSFNFDIAKEYFYKALQLDDSPETITNAIFYNSIINNETETLRLIDLFIELHPDNNHAKTLKGFNYLKKMEFESGWNYYKYRDSKDMIVTYVRNNNQIIEWDMSSDVENLIIITDQGIGDEIMFLRILEFINCSKCTLCIDDRLIEIVKNSFMDIKVVGKKEIYENTNHLNSYSHYVLLPDLCSKYVKNEDSLIKLKSSYLKVNRKLKSELKEKIIDESKVNIGLSWHTTNQNRFTANLKECEVNMLSAISSHNLINLQYGNHQEIINKNKIKYLKEIDYTKDVNEIFRIIDVCDLVVTIDNCIAHFSGSIGKKTFLLLPFNSDWRWFDNTKNTAWYQSITILKQDKDFSYISAIKDIITHTKSLS